jgi:hypothetical protein
MGSLQPSEGFVGERAGASPVPAGPSDPERGRDPEQDLVAALLPVLLHRIRNTTQLLTGVNALLAQDDALSPRRAEDLALAAHQAEDLGCLLGVLSGGLGAALADTRRAPGALAVTLELVRDALRRAQGELGLPAGPLPGIADAPRPAVLCWCVAGLVWHAARGARGAELSIDERAGAWSLRLGGARAGVELGALRELAGARYRAEAEGWTLELPAAWLARGPIDAA